MEYSVRNLEYAVSVFYNGEHGEREKAHEWLTTIQRAPEAWNFVWELLQPNKGTEIQFYAATTLHTKILRCWNELPPESHDELKDKIMQAVLTYCNGPKIVTNRLCISLAAFILQKGTVDLATILRPLSTVENTSLLLEVLTVIPEEYNSMTMGSTLRSKNKAALQQACPAVLDDMLRNLQTVFNDYSKEPPTESTVMCWMTSASCACSWLTLGGEESDCIIAPLPDRLPLCQALLTAVHVLCTWNEAVSDAALDACEACLSAVRAAGGAAEAARYPSAGVQLLAHLAALAAPVMARDDKPNSINEELLAAVVTCCVALGETHAAALVQAAQSTDNTDEVAGARKLLELILRAQATPGHYPLQETRSNLVFGFWYTLQEEILNLMEKGNQLHPVWREVFSRLLMTLVNKSELPAESALCKVDLELLRCYRQDIADTVMYCFGVLGEWCWSAVESAYSSAASDARREAALHVFWALSDAAPTRRVAQPLIAMLQQAVGLVHTSRDRRVLETALDCLGGYASWLSEVEGADSAALGRECVRAAGGALQRCPASAALALRKLCEDCSASAAELAPDIVHAAQSSEGRSDPWVWRQLVAASGAALAAAELHTAVPLLKVLAQILQEDLRLQALDPTRRSGAPQCCVALLSALAPQPALASELFAAILPTLPALAQHLILVEYMFNILKEAVSTLMEKCLPHVNEISQLIVAGFSVYPCETGLDLVQLIVLALGDDWPNPSDLFHTGVACSSPVIEADPWANPDLTEGLFLALQAVAKKKAQYLDWIEDVMSDVIELGLTCLQQWEPRVASSACKWLAALALHRPNKLQPYAPELTALVLRCIGGVTPRNQMEPLTALLLALNRATWPPGGEGLSAWLRQALAPPGFPTQHAADHHKHKFITAVLKEKTSKRRIFEAVQEFSLVCRGLIDTEYARQTIASKQMVA